MCPISTRCSSPIPAPRRSRRRSSSRARATGRPGIVYCDHAFHGLTYGALSLNGDPNFRDGFEPLLPGLHVQSRSTISPRWSRRCPRARSRPSSSSRSRARASTCPTDDYLPSAADALPPLRHAVRRRRDPDRHRPHRQIPRGRALERRARHGAAREGAVRRPCAGRRGADAQEHLRQGVQPHGSRRGARLDLRQERSGDGGRHRHARRA